MKKKKDKEKKETELERQKFEEETLKAIYRYIG